MPADPTPSDPLLTEPPQRFGLVGPPERTTIGNSIRTLVLVGVLVALGVTFWWFRRPDDLSTQLGAREWVVVEVDGEPVPTGRTSAFVLDGSGEAMATVSCATSTGAWSYDAGDEWLDVEWTSVSNVACPEDWHPTVRPTSGSVAVAGAAVTIENARGSLRAVDLRAAGPAEPEEFAGTWGGPDGLRLELGQRGLAVIDGCEGSWREVGDGAITIEVDEVSVERGLCDPPALWVSGTPLIPVRIDDWLFLQRAALVFPFDRDVQRLDLVPPPGASAG